MNTKPCPICRENHGPACGLSWDGMGLNSCGMYRSRIATFLPAYREHGEKITRAINSHDAMRRALAELLNEIQHVDGEPGLELSNLTRAEFDEMLARGREALAAAGGDPHDPDDLGAPEPSGYWRTLPGHATVSRETVATETGNTLEFVAACEHEESGQVCGKAGGPWFEFMPE